jgi:hypothetical protein
VSNFFAFDAAGIAGTQQYTVCLKYGYSWDNNRTSFFRFLFFLPLLRSDCLALLIGWIYGSHWELKNGGGCSDNYARQFSFWAFPSSRDGTKRVYVYWQQDSNNNGWWYWWNSYRGARYFIDDNLPGSGWNSLFQFFAYSTSLPSFFFLFPLLFFSFSFFWFSDNPCTTSPCDAKAACTNQGNWKYTCNCQAGYSGSGTKGQCQGLSFLFFCPPRLSSCCNDPFVFFFLCCFCSQRSMLVKAILARLPLLAPRLVLAPFPVPANKATKERVLFVTKSMPGLFCFFSLFALSFPPLIYLSVLSFSFCSSKSNPCSSNGICSKTGPGTYSCKCKTGYEGDGVACTPIDACKKNNPCSGYAACTSTGPGTYQCTCNTGYQGNGITCTEIDNCAKGPCSPNAVCVLLFFFSLLLYRFFFLCVFF